MGTAYHFTVAEFDRMIERDVFQDDAQVELIRGEIQTMVPPNPAHEDVVDRLMYWSVDVTARDEIRVRIQNSVGLPEFDSVPEPDVAWMRARDYRLQRPQAGDVLLLIEVSDSSLAKDRLVKGPLYAQAGIQEYWIVNLVDSCLEVHRQPSGRGYGSITVHSGDETVHPFCAPAAGLSLGRLFGQCE